jgi:hypothetical protein
VALPLAGGQIGGATTVSSNPDSSFIADGEERSAVGAVCIGIANHAAAVRRHRLLPIRSHQVEPAPTIALPAATVAEVTIELATYGAPITMLR